MAGHPAVPSARSHARRLIRPSTTLRVSVVVLATLATTLSACGSRSSDTGSSAPAPSAAAVTSAPVLDMSGTDPVESVPLDDPIVGAAPTSAPATGSTGSFASTGTLPVYQGGIAAGWADYGWSDRTMGPGPVTVDIGNFGGFILAWPAGADDLAAKGPFVGLELSFAAGPEITSEVIGVQLADAAGTDFPVIGAGWGPAGPDGLRVARIAFDQLDPLRKGFDRIVVKSARRVPAGTRVTVDHIDLLT